MQTWLHFRKHGAYPEAGSYNDQDEALMQDWHTVELRYAILKGRSQTARAFELNEDTPRNDWMTAFG